MKTTKWDQIKEEDTLNQKIIVKMTTVHIFFFTPALYPALLQRLELVQLWGARQLAAHTAPGWLKAA